MAESSLISPADVTSPSLFPFCGPACYIGGLTLERQALPGCPHLMEAYNPDSDYRWTAPHGMYPYRGPIPFHSVASILDHFFLRGILFPNTLTSLCFFLRTDLKLFIQHPLIPQTHFKHLLYASSYVRHFTNVVSLILTNSK